MQENFSFFLENHFSSTDEDDKEDREDESPEENKKSISLKNVVKAIKIITNKESIPKPKKEFIPGIVKNHYKLFCEYRTKFQNDFFHYLDKGLFDDTKKLINNSFLFTENKKAKLLKYDSIELQQISSNLENSNYSESYKKVNDILDDLLINFSSLKSLQQERIKPKFGEEEIENRKIDKEIRHLVITMMKKITFCENLIKMEKNKNIKNEKNMIEKVKYNVKMCLIEKIKNFTNDFRKNEQQFLKYLKEIGGGGEEFLVKNNDNDKYNLHDSFSSLDDEKETLNKDFLYTQEDDLQLEIKRRDEDINILANSINVLADIFKDLQTVVQEQGTILDRIDYNIDVSYQNSNQGLKSLKKAEKNQNQSRLRNLILLLFFIIFIESILIILKIV